MRAFRLVIIQNLRLSREQKCLHRPWRRETLHNLVKEATGINFHEFSNDIEGAKEAAKGILGLIPEDSKNVLVDTYPSVGDVNEVHPSSISVDSTIGNMRLRDMCDTRNQGTESVIKDYMLSLRPPIHLEWDHGKKRALAKKEQVVITWKDMSPFLDYVPQRRSSLADVLSIPGEIFGLENLKGMLSYEVWENCLSESERNLLTQYGRGPIRYAL